MSIQIRNKNVLKELLSDKTSFENIQIAQGLQKDSLTNEILSLAKKNGVVIQEVPYRKMPFSRSGKVNEAIVGYVKEPKEYKLNDLIFSLRSKGENAFFLLLNRVSFPTNIGYICRTAFAAGVNGLIYQGDNSTILNDEVIHISMGTVLRIPLIKASIFDAIKELTRSNVKTYSLDMKGKSMYDTNLTGGVAFVLGEESEGISSTVSGKCTGTISIKMRAGIDSLNVGISAAIVMYEKIRQDLAKQLP